MDLRKRCSRLVEPDTESGLGVLSSFRKQCFSMVHSDFCNRLTHDRKERRVPAGTREEVRFRSYTSMLRLSADCSVLDHITEQVNDVVLRSRRGKVVEASMSSSNQVGIP